MTSHSAELAAIYGPPEAQRILQPLGCCGVSSLQLFVVSRIPRWRPRSQASSQAQGLAAASDPLISRGGGSKLTSPATAMHPHGSGSRLSESGQNRMLRWADQLPPPEGPPPPAAPAVGNSGLAEDRAGTAFFVKQARWPHPFATCTSSRAALTPARRAVCSRAPDPPVAPFSISWQQGQGRLHGRNLWLFGAGAWTLAPPGFRRASALITGSPAWKRFCRSQHPAARGRALALQCNCCPEIDHHRPLRHDLARRSRQLMDAVVMLPIQAVPEATARTTASRISMEAAKLMLVEYQIHFHGCMAVRLFHPQKRWVFD